MDKQEIHEITNQFSYLTKDQFVQALLDAGLVTQEQLNNAPTLVKLNELRKERTAIYETIEKLETRADELTTQIQNLCTHEWSEEKHSDGWDGWSRVAVEVTATKRCKLCNLVHERKYTINR